MKNNRQNYSVRVSRYWSDEEDKIHEIATMCWHYKNNTTNTFYIEVRAEDIL